MFLRRLMAVLVPAALSLLAPMAAAEPIATNAKHVYIADFQTGAVLYDKAAEERLHPASMSKLMTVYMLFDALKRGDVKLTDTFHVSQKAWAMQGSKMFVDIDSDVKVEDLIRGMIVDSGNDACIVLAEGIAGSEGQFVDLMNKEAKVLGLQHSHFVNCTGWPDPGHVMSARDIAIVGSRLVRDFPKYYKYDSEKTFKYNNIEQQNRNPLVQKGTADGMKTGHTDAGGYGLVGSAERNGRRIVMVLNGMNTMRQRAEEGERLLEWGFREFENVTLFLAGDTVENAPVWLGTSPTVPLVGGRDVVVTMPRGWREKARVEVAYDSPIKAPVVRGTSLGKLAVSGPGVPQLEVPLLAGADVARMGLAGRAVAVLEHYVTKR